ELTTFRSEAKYFTSAPRKILPKVANSLSRWLNSERISVI
ncbi:unnamed protein product, partial [Larinioides sclopetarius]